MLRIANESARFMQAVRAPAGFIPCDEFDFRVIFVEREVAFDLQAEPARAVVAGCVEIGGQVFSAHVMRR